MATVEQYLAKAASQIGNDDTTYNNWYWGYRGAAWCATFQSWVAAQLGGAGFKSAAVSGVYEQLAPVGSMTLAGVKRGDLVCFNWDGRRDTVWMDHIGVVEWIDPGSGAFGTIEGNTTNVYGGRVARMARTIYGGYFVAFCRPEYEKEVKPMEATPIWQYPTNGTGAQKWIFYPVKDVKGNIKYTHIINLKTGKAFDGDLTGDRKLNAGDKLVGWPFVNGAKNQQWDVQNVRANKLYSIVRFVSMMNKKLAINSGGKNQETNFVLKAFDGTRKPGQEFILVPYGTTDKWCPFKKKVKGQVYTIINRYSQLPMDLKGGI